MRAPIVPVLALIAAGAHLPWISSRGKSSSQPEPAGHGEVAG